MWWILPYNLLFPLVFLAYLPGMIRKLVRRDGVKSTFKERFGVYDDEKRDQMRKSFQGAIWLHAVSVGEANLAVDLVRHYHALYPGRKFVLSTTTTTGQQVVQEARLPNTLAVFCPIDFYPVVARVFNMVRPSAMAIMETEIWPSMLYYAKSHGIPTVLVNGRLSDKSFPGYRTFRLLFAPLFRLFSALLVQTEGYRDRYLAVCPGAQVEVCGNLKMERMQPRRPAFNLSSYLGDGERIVLTGASLHGEEPRLLAASYLSLKERYPQLKLVLVPRHVESGDQVKAALGELGIRFATRTGNPNGLSKPVDVFMVDTTGEQVGVIQQSDIVFVGKSLAGHDEGHNLMEPVSFGKVTVTGARVRNFSDMLRTLESAGAVATVDCDEALPGVLAGLLGDPARRKELSDNAEKVASRCVDVKGKYVERIEALLGGVSTEE